MKLTLSINFQLFALIFSFVLKSIMNNKNEIHAIDKCYRGVCPDFSLEFFGHIPRFRNEVWSGKKHDPEFFHLYKKSLKEFYWMKSDKKSLDHYAGATQKNSWNLAELSVHTPLQEWDFKEWKRNSDNLICTKRDLNSFTKRNQREVTRSTGTI